MNGAAERSTDSQRGLQRERWMRKGRWFGQGVVLSLLAWNTVKPDGTHVAAKAEAEVQVSHEASADAHQAAGRAIKTNTKQIAALKDLVDTSSDQAQASCKRQAREMKAYLRGIERALHLSPRRVARAAKRQEAGDVELAKAKMQQVWAKSRQEVSNRLYTEAGRGRKRRLKVPPRKLKQLLRQKARKGELPPALAE